MMITLPGAVTGGVSIKELAVEPKQGPYAREYLEKEVSEDFLGFHLSIPY